MSRTTPNGDYDSTNDIVAHAGSDVGAPGGRNGHENGEVAAAASPGLKSPVSKALKVTPSTSQENSTLLTRRDTSESLKSVRSDSGAGKEAAVVEKTRRVLDRKTNA
ncbi:hypothetical protein CC2G_013758 [Coprinopsis cinerea AmutBmut pab1-1]|nr:hypothetical protein CC2G_013758 [Coprinopsis cinerea AmutBmut pab1-1]